MELHACKMLKDGIFIPLCVSFAIMFVSYEDEKYRSLEKLSYSKLT